MRVSAGFSRLLWLKGVSVKGVCFESDRAAVQAALRRRRLVWPECSFSTPPGHNVREAQRAEQWRQLGGRGCPPPGGPVPLGAGCDPGAVGWVRRSARLRSIG